MKAKNLGLVSVLALALNGCAMAPTPVTGFVYTKVKGPMQATDAYGGSAHGEACATSILGVYASGDASIETAKKNGGVAQVVTVDHTTDNILGLFAKFCTHVYGKRGATSAAPAAAPKAGGEG